ncbi:DUF6319 family protein [Umezawaea tangerina]|uniref:Mucin n=1 Tax=Umezawaea tangerina TaxID=84725 RepID=A0A2T0SBZ2_9PSEU|nr:DUF6319 family protein [Umezawaea tangerina]PRY30922.1 hypothetical protein CLV43_12324 [Umezawaea tangerina]
MANTLTEQDDQVDAVEATIPAAPEASANPLSPKPADKPADTPADTSADKQADKPTDAPVQEDPPAKPVKRAKSTAKKTRTVELTLTVTGTMDGDWQADLLHGTTRVVQGLSIPAIAVSKAAKELHEDIFSGIETVLEAARDQHRTRMEELEAELAKVKQALAELSD